MIYKKTLFIRLLPLLLCAVLLTGAVILPAMAKENDLSFVTIGSGEISSKTSAGMAKKAAIQAAQQQAVGAALEAVVPLNVLTDNFKEISGLAFANQQQFISNYEVLAVSEEPDMSRVLVRVTVSQPLIQKAVRSAGILLDSDNPPIVLVLISEVNQDQPQDPPVASSSTLTEKALTRSFSQKGISTISHDNRSSDNASDNTDISDTQAINLARESNADFVIIGRTEISSPLKGMLPAGIKQKDSPPVLTLSGRLLNVRNGSAMAQVSERNVPETTGADSNQTAEDIQTRLAAAGQTLARKFAPPIVIAWENRGEMSQAMTVTIQGASTISRLEAFRKSLQDNTKVKNISISEMGMSQTIMKVDFAGNTKQLAAAIASYSPQSLRVQIIEISDNNIRLTFGS